MLLVVSCLLLLLLLNLLQFKLTFLLSVAAGPDFLSFTRSCEYVCFGFVLFPSLFFSLCSRICISFGICSCICICVWLGVGRVLQKCWPVAMCCSSVCLAFGERSSWNRLDTLPKSTTSVAVRSCVWGVCTRCVCVCVFSNKCRSPARFGGDFYSSQIAFASLPPLNLNLSSDAWRFLAGIRGGSSSGRQVTDRLAIHWPYSGVSPRRVSGVVLPCRKVQLKTFKCNRRRTGISNKTIPKTLNDSLETLATWLRWPRGESCKWSPIVAKFMP